MIVVDLLQEAIDVIFGPAELRQNERGIEVQFHHAAQREDHIFRTQRVTGGEFRIFAQFKGQAAVIAAGLPRSGQCRFQVHRILRVRLYQTLIDIRKSLNAGQFKPFGRVEAVGVVGRLGNHQRIFWCCGLCCEGGSQRQRQQ